MIKTNSVSLFPFRPAQSHHLFLCVCSCMRVFIILYIISSFVAVKKNYISCFVNDHVYFIRICTDIHTILYMLYCMICGVVPWHGCVDLYIDSIFISSSFFIIIMMWTSLKRTHQCLVVMNAAQTHLCTAHTCRYLIIDMHCLLQPIRKIAFGC